MENKTTEVTHAGGTGPNEFQAQYEAQHPELAEAPQEPTQPTEVEATQVSTTPVDPVGVDASQATNETTPEPQAPEQSPQLQEQIATLQAQLADLQAISAGEQATNQTQPVAVPSAVDALNFTEFRPTTELAEELQPYREQIGNLVAEYAAHAVSRLEQRAETLNANHQANELRTTLQSQVRELQSGVDAADFRTHYNEVVNLAVESPTLLQQRGVKGILDLVRGHQGHTTPPQDTQNGFDAGVQATLQGMQARKAAAVDNPSPSGAATNPVPFAVPKGTSMNDAVAMAFKEAVKSASG